MKKIVIILLLLLSACSGTINFDVVENDDGYSGDFDVVLDETSTDLPDPTEEPTSVPDPTNVPDPTPTQEQVLELDFQLTQTLNYRSFPTVGTDSYITTLSAGTTGVVYQYYVGTTYTWLKIEVDDLCHQTGWIALISNRINIAGDYTDLIEVSVPSATSYNCSTATIQDGYNINANAVANLDSLLATVASECSNGHLVMDGIWLADAIYEAMVQEGCDPPTIVIRSYQPCEGDCYATLSPFSIVDRWCQLAALSPYAEEYLWEAINEPPPNEQLLQWSIDVSNLAANSPCGIDFKAALPAFGVGRVHSVDSGLYDAFGATLQQNGDFLSIHNYFIGVPASGWGQLNGQHLVAPIVGGDVRFLRDNFCPTNLNWSYEYDPSQPNTWYHMGREWRLIQRWYSLGYTNIGIVITEFGTDNLPDVRAEDQHGVLRPVNDILRDTYGHDVRGIGHYREYYASVFPELTFGQAIYKVMECAVSQYPVYDGIRSGYVLIASFSWSSDAGWANSGFALDGVTGQYADAIREWRQIRS